MSMKILGISAFYHDSAAVLIEDDAITAAARPAWQDASDWRREYGLD